MIQSLVRIKKTGQRVVPIGSSDGQWTLCLFPFDKVSRKGQLGAIQPVRSENLIDDRQEIQS